MEWGRICSQDYKSLGNKSEKEKRGITPNIYILHSNESYQNEEKV
jgi:hypothetical protein